MLSVSPKKILINVLESHPEGLTLVSLADISGLHRHTATKYVRCPREGAGTVPADGAGRRIVPGPRGTGNVSLCARRV